MFNKLIGFAWALSCVATIILFCGKIFGDIEVSWSAVPFPVMLVLSIVALESALAFWAIRSRQIVRAPESEDE